MTLQATPPRSGRALILSFFLIFGALMLCGASVLVLVLTFGTPKPDSSNALTFSLLAGGLFFSAILLLPAIYFNISLFFCWPDLNVNFLHVHESIPLIILAVFWGLTLLLGQLFSSTAFAVIFLPFLNVLAVALPVIFFLRLALRKLAPPSAQQAWSAFGVTLLIGPVLGGLLEMLALVIILVIVALFASLNPVLAPQVNHLIEIAQREGSSDALTAALTTTILPMLFTPVGLLIIFGIFSVIVPIIEESVKVLALWLFADQIKHPIQGFVLGALCGAAFALAENIGFSSTGSSEWTWSVLQRATAILPHTLNSGILGWALVSAWRERAYFKLGGAYLAVILVHGAWNGISIALALSTLTAYASPNVGPIFASTTAFTIGEIVMMLGTFGGLIYANYALRRSQPAQAEYNVPPSLPNSINYGDDHGIH